MKRIALLALPALLVAGCQDHRWAENDSPVCNQTAEPEVQEIAGKLDILFVIDSSGTMREEQNNIAANFGAFIAELVGEDGDATDVDYQIGVVTTDTEASGCLLYSADGDPRHRIINDETDRPYWTDQRIRDVFAANIQPPPGGSFEQGLEAMRCSLDHPDNADLLRSGSKLAVVFVSDENDCSHPACDPMSPGCIDGGHPLFGCDDLASELTPVEEYFDWLVDEDGFAGPADTGKRPPKQVIVAGIVGVRDDTAQAIPLHHEGGVRDYAVACWPFVEEQRGDGGAIAVDPTTGSVTLRVPAAQHAFSDADENRFARVPYSAASAEMGTWPIVAVDPAANVAQLNTQAVIEDQASASWALGTSDGLATEGSRYVELITRTCKASGRCRRDDQIPTFASTICTSDWSETMRTIGAVVRLSSDFCLDALPTGIDDLTCPAIEQWVRVELHDEGSGQFTPFACDDAEHPWTLLTSDTCGSGWAIHFDNSTREAPFPEPGRGLRIQYLAAQGNSERCLMTQTAE